MTTGTDTQPRQRLVQLTGLAYLANAVTGALSYFVIRPELIVAGDAPATMMRLVDNEALARVGLVVDLALITSGTLTALLFFALFRSLDTALAVALTAFAFMGGVAITVGTIASAKALDVAIGGTETYESASALVLVLSELHDTSWSIGALFFGLWLIPLGVLALRSGWIPRILGWTLAIGGVGYIASAALDQLRPEASTAVELLTMPASLGEFSMIIYLLIRGVRSNGLTSRSMATAQLETA